MSERERWIVYPLLFLALGAALRDKMIKQTRADRVLCEELYCERIVCGSLDAKQAVKSPLVQADAINVGLLLARSMRQNNQPVLSFNPQNLPQYNPGGWQAPPTATPPLALPDDGSDTGETPPE